MISHWLHCQDSDVLLQQNRKDLGFETVEVMVHDVQGHLDRIECEVMSSGSRQHFEVDLGALVAGKADMAYLASLLRLLDCLQGASGREDSVRIRIANDFMKLQKVNTIGLEPLQRFIDLIRCGRLVPAIDFGH